MSETSRVSVARNPKATHDYFILETIEAGLVLRGTEVKSLRAGKASIKEAWAQVKQGELWLEGMNITPYEQGNRWNHQPMRTRKLLLHRREIERLIGALEREGRTIVPLELYFLKGKAKVALGLAKGKQAHDKRESIKRREADREMARAVASRGRE
jgi:SsrA-binding protein